MSPTLLLAAALAAGCSNPVYLKSGQVLCSQTPPASAFGRVVCRIEGRARSLPSSQVDVARTLAAARGSRRGGSFTVTDVGDVRRAGIDYIPPVTAVLPKKTARPCTTGRQSRTEPLLSSHDRMRARSEHRKAERTLQMANQLKAIHYSRALTTGSRRDTSKAYLAETLHRQALDRLEWAEQRLDPRDRRKIEK